MTDTIGRIVTIAVLALALVACESPGDRAVRLQREVDLATLDTYAARQRLDSVMAAYPAYDAHPYFAPYSDSLVAAQAREGRLREELRRATGGR